MTERPPADVALILEGTYPFVAGGVSSWVHEIVRGLPELTFDLIFLGSRRDLYSERRFQLPENVRSLECEYLFEPFEDAPPRAKTLGRRMGDSAERLHRALSGEHPAAQAAAEAARALTGEHRLTREHFLHGRESWERLQRAYSESCPGAPFTEYFWTVRSMHGPLFRLGAFARRLSPARCYHAISTGYAGLLGALLRELHGRPLAITEHGIYTKERGIDLAAAEWLSDPAGPFAVPSAQGHPLRALWLRFFQALGRLAYASADPVISLSEANRQRQVADGASEERTRVIPNGIDVARFSPLRALRPPDPPPVLGLLGRVVPIKDVKTFVRAVRLLRERIPGAEGWLIGPVDEDPGYARECKELVERMGLGAAVRFLGFRKPEEVLPKLGLLTLTSISEAQPLVVLEAYASGLPVLTTDVGACRELVEGRAPEDRALGPGGAVVPIADPAATAAAAAELLGDPGRWRAAQQAAIARVERFYTRACMLDRYRQVYEEARAWRG